MAGLAGSSVPRGASGPRPVKAEERRTAQRVLLRVQARVHVALQGKPTTLDVATLSVNPSGALVLMKQGLPVETRLVLEHKATKERVACKVAHPPREMPEGFHVPLEFDAPSPTFWKIDFPPADWRPEDLEARPGYDPSDWAKGIDSVGVRCHAQSPSRKRHWR